MTTNDEAPEWDACLEFLCLVNHGVRLVVNV